MVGDVVVVATVVVVAVVVVGDAVVVGTGPARRARPRSGGEVGDHILVAATAARPVVVDDGGVRLRLAVVALLHVHALPAVERRAVRERHDALAVLEDLEEADRRVRRPLHVEDEVVPDPVLLVRVERRAAERRVVEVAAPREEDHRVLHDVERDRLAGRPRVVKLRKGIPSRRVRREAGRKHRRPRVPVLMTLVAVGQCLARERLRALAVPGAGDVVVARIDLIAGGIAALTARARDDRRATVGLLLDAEAPLGEVARLVVTAPRDGGGRS